MTENGSLSKYFTPLMEHNFVSHKTVTNYMAGSSHGCYLTHKIEHLTPHY